MARVRSPADPSLAGGSLPDRPPHAPPTRCDISPTGRNRTLTRSAGRFDGAESGVPVSRPRPTWRRRARSLTAGRHRCRAGVLSVLAVARPYVVAGTAGIVVMSVLWLPATRRWNARGHLCWTATVYLFIVYLVFILNWTFVSRLGIASTIGGVVLWLFELAAAILACAYLWELCDALGTEQWRRRVTRSTPRAQSPGGLPFVSLHVPAHNEPPDMVIQTLTSLLRLDYPNYEIVAIDDNTDDEQTWRPVADWCASHGVKFVHLQEWPGYKSGALNYALRE